LNQPASGTGRGENPQSIEKNDRGGSWPGKERKRGLTGKRCHCQKNKNPRRCRKRGNLDAQKKDVLDKTASTSSEGGKKSDFCRSTRQTARNRPAVPEKGRGIATLKGGGAAFQSKRKKKTSRIRGKKKRSVFFGQEKRRKQTGREGGNRRNRAGWREKKQGLGLARKRQRKKEGLPLRGKPRRCRKVIHSQKGGGWETLPRSGKGEGKPQIVFSKKGKNGPKEPPNVLGKGS